MNDDFLYQLRVRPPARFAAKLKLKLDLQSATATARRRAMRWYLLGGIFMGSLAIALVVPQTRTAMIDRVAQLRVDTDGSRVSHDEPLSSVADRTEAQNVNSVEVVPTQRGAPVVEAAGDAAANAEPVQPASMSASPLVPSATAVNAVLRPVTVSSQVPAALVDALFASYSEKYGFPVQRKTDAPCANPPFADLVIAVGGMSEEVLRRCKGMGSSYSEVPIAHEAFIAVVHRENTWATSLTLEELRRIAERPSRDAVTTWNQVRPQWPSLPIAIFGTVPADGTFADRFTPDRKSRSLPVAVKSGDDDIVDAVAVTYGALGFMSYATFEAQRAARAKDRQVLPVNVVPIVNELGEAVMPSRQSIEDGRYDTLSRSLVMHVHERRLFRNEVRLFVSHALQEWSPHLIQLGYVPTNELTRASAVRKLPGAVAAGF